MSALEERVHAVLNKTDDWIGSDPEWSIDFTIATRLVVAAVYDELTRPGPTRERAVQQIALAIGDYRFAWRAETAWAAALGVVFADDTQETE